MMSSTAPRVAPITQPVKNQAVPDCISKARNFRQPLVLQTRETAKENKSKPHLNHLNPRKMMEALECQLGLKRPSEAFTRENGKTGNRKALPKTAQAKQLPGM